MDRNRDQINSRWVEYSDKHLEDVPDMNDFVLQRQLETGHEVNAYGPSPRDTDGRRLLSNLTSKVLDDRKHTKKNLDDSTYAMRDSVSYVNDPDYDVELRSDFPNPFTRMERRKRK